MYKAGEEKDSNMEIEDGEMDEQRLIGIFYFFKCYCSMSCNVQCSHARQRWAKCWIMTFGTSLMHVHVMLQSAEWLAIVEI